MKIGYVCTNYNNSDFSLAAVNSLLRNIGHDIQVVVVDNASAEVEVKKLRSLAQLNPSVQIIESSENTGYFRGLNMGLRAIRSQRPDINWVVVGNNDLEFPLDFCASVECRENQLRAHPVISPDVVTLDGQHQNPHVIANISAIREFFYDLYHINYHFGRFIHKVASLIPRLTDRSDEKQWRIAQSIYQGHGSCYILGPRFFEQFQELWAPTFMMAEEFFLSKQLEDAGCEVWYDPSICVTHHWHGSLAKLPSRRRWEMARDAHREYRKYVKGFLFH